MPPFFRFRKKKIFDSFLSIFDSGVARFLRYKPISVVHEHRRFSPVLFFSRGALEHAFLWRSFNWWSREDVAGMLRQPLHRNIWTTPPLSYFIAATVTFTGKGWVDLIVGRLSFTWRHWLFNRLIIFSVCFAVVYSAVALFAFIFFFLEFLLSFFSFSALWFKHCFSIFFYFYPLFSFLSFSLLFLFCLFNSVFILSPEFGVKKFPYRRAVWPRWTVRVPLARKSLQTLIRRSNLRARFSRRLFRQNFWSLWSLCGRSPILAFISNFRNVVHDYALNHFSWEVKPRYKPQGVWHYNVTYDFWFDYYLNYAAFTGADDWSLRYLFLEVHPFLFIRHIMTDLAKGPLRLRKVFRRRFLFHYARNRRIFFFGILVKLFSYHLLRVLWLLKFCFLSRNFSFANYCMLTRELSILDSSFTPVPSLPFWLPVVTDRFKKWWRAFDLASKALPIYVSNFLPSALLFYDSVFLIRHQRQFLWQLLYVPFDRKRRQSLVAAYRHVFSRIDSLVFYEPYLATRLSHEFVFLRHPLAFVRLFYFFRKTANPFGIFLLYQQFCFVLRFYTFHARRRYFSAKKNKNNDIIF